LSGLCNKTRLGVYNVLGQSVRSFVRQQTCEHDMLKTNEQILRQTAPGVLGGN